MMRGYYGYGSGYGSMMDGGWLGAVLMIGFWLLVLVGLVLLVVWAVRSAAGHGHGHGHMMGHMGPGSPMSAPGHDEAVAIARKRLATGEITKEQYDQIMQALG